MTKLLAHFVRDGLTLYGAAFRGASNEVACVAANGVRCVGHRIPVMLTWKFRNFVRVSVRDRQTGYSCFTGPLMAEIGVMGSVIISAI